MKHYDIFIIGAGAAGISAAKSAWNAGCRSIVLADRKSSMGGILLQCAHHGFGHGLNGPEYTQKLLENFPDEITFYDRTTVLSVTEDRTATLSSPNYGLQRISFEQMILATGCREIPLGALSITGTRPKGIFTAGQMQELMNIHLQIPQGPAVILGSGDLGLIMAAQLAQSGVKIAGLIEKGPACGGMLRNRSCLDRYDIPLICNTTIAEIYGYPNLEGVLLTNGTYLSCRTLLVAVGLVPEQGLIRPFSCNTSFPDWLHICGNARQVHPMADSVVSDGTTAGTNAYNKLSSR